MQFLFNLSGSQVARNHLWSPVTESLTATATDRKSKVISGHGKAFKAKILTKKMFARGKKILAKRGGHFESMNWPKNLSLTDVLGNDSDQCRLRD